MYFIAFASPATGHLEENMTTRPTLPMQAAQHLGVANGSTPAEFKGFAYPRGGRLAGGHIA